MIPKIIHQTWKTNEIPNIWLYGVNKCKQLHKEYKYILWTDELMNDFIKKEYPAYYDMYISYKYMIQRCDAFRYFVLYKYGGIYLDLDIICKHKLDELFNYEIVLGKSPNMNIITNSFIMSSKKNDLMLYCIKNLNKNNNNYKYLGKHLHVMYSTGPMFLNKCVNEYIKKINHTHIHILNKYEFYNDCNTCNIKKCKGGKYFKNLEGKSWNSYDTKFINFINCNKQVILFLIIILIIYFFYHNQLH